MKISTFITIFMSALLLGACGGGSGVSCSAGLGSLVSSSLGCKTETANTTTVANVIPVARAGVDQNVLTGAKVTLDGSKSTDANNDSLTYRWVMTSKPANSIAVLSSGSDPMPTFTADLAGSFVITLIVNDGNIDSANVQVTVNSVFTNAVPVANAGIAQDVLAGNKVTLDGSKSSDANNDVLTYKWVLTTKPTGSNALLSSSTNAMPSFTPDVVGTYLATLTVNDGKVDSVAVPVTIKAVFSNAVPVANAGISQSVLAASKVTLDGSKSTDANNDALTYKWVLTSKPPSSLAVLSSSTDAMPSYTADVPGTYVATLIVNDGLADSAPAQVSVKAVLSNAAPVANPGVTQNVLAASKVTLDGSKSTDANSDVLTYKWVLTIKPTGSIATLTSGNDAIRTFVPDLPGTYAASLTVNDGISDSLTEIVPIIVTTANAVPVANAGVAQSVVTGTKVTLDGSASSDANRDVLTYKWTLFSKPPGSTAVLSLDTTVKPTFTADLSGTYAISLVVNDAVDKSVLVAVAVTAAAGNIAPVANAGTNLTVASGALVTLDGSASSDANRDVLTYKWIMLGKPSASTAALSSSTVAKPTFTADVTGTYVASLIVNDGLVNSTATSVAITSNAAPVAVSGADQSVKAGILVTLDGSKSTDANNDTLNYKWVLVSKPSGSTAALSLGTVAKPTFTADLPGDYTATLIVNDGLVDSPIVGVKITATAI